jgi:DNA-directed RNA polymerase omega subunit
MAFNESAPPYEPLDTPADAAEPIHSRFLFVDVAALRAKQLRRGARVRIEATDVAHLPKKAERIAMEEVRQGLVPYDVVPARSAGAATDAAGSETPVETPRAPRGWGRDDA